MSRQKPTIREALLTDPTTRDESTQEAYERNFYTRLRLANDVYKTTHSRRFEDVNPIVNALLPRGQPIEALDVGISSGISTLEWLESMRAAGISAHVIGGDLDVTGYLISIGPWIDTLVDRTGYLLQIDLGRRAVTNHHRYPTARRWLLALPVFVINAIFRVFWLAQPTLRRHIAENGGELVTRSGIRCRPISLFSPRLRPSPALELIEDDIVRHSDRFADTFDVIRAGNVLNRYLDPQLLTAMLKTLRFRLKVGGLLVVCRTDLQETNLGTVFRLRADRSFEVVQRFSTGSEIEQFVLSGGDPAALARR